jgi:hypothetical protein
MENNDYITLCCNGRLEEAKEFLENNPNHYVYYMNGSLCLYACLQGHLHVAQWLFSVDPTISGNIIDNNFIIFQNACGYGHLHIAQWLLSLNLNVNISDFDRESFRLACLQGHYHLALWLLTVSPNVNLISLATDEAKNYIAESFFVYCFDYKNINLAFL